MPMENDEHEQRDIDEWVSAALAPARGASARIVTNALRAQDALPARPWCRQPVKFVALGATGLALAMLVAAFAWPHKPASPALVIIAGQSPAPESGGSYVMVVPVQREVK
jgi:hypothetical protein